MPEENLLTTGTPSSNASWLKVLPVPIGWLTLLLVLNGCAVKTKVYPLSDHGVTVVGDTVYENGVPFAQVRYLGGWKGSGIFRGLGIYYYQYDKEIWISPKEGWTLQHDGVEYRRIEDINRIAEEYYEKDLEWQQGRGPMPGSRPVRRIGGRRPHKLEPGTRILNIKISADGKYIYYTKRDFFESTHKYLVEYGVSK